MSRSSLRRSALAVAIVLSTSAVKLVSAQQIVGMTMPDAQATTSVDHGDVISRPPESAAGQQHSDDLIAPWKDNPHSDRPCVLLTNDNVLFGSASQLGEFVIVTRGPGNEIRLPRGQVACWADSLADLYQYRVDHRRQGDLSAHLNDARWCLNYDLFELAEQEIELVLGMEADNREAKQLQQQLLRIKNARQSHRPSQPLAVRKVDFQSTTQRSGDSTSASDPQMIHDFAANIQPMLINRCGNCHSHDSQRRWQILTPTVGTRPSARMTKENLAASLEFIDLAAPQASQLLAQAVTPHGGADARLNLRHEQATETLRRWLDHLAGNASQPPIQPAPPQPVAVGWPHHQPGISPLPVRPTDPSDSDQTGVDRHLPTAPQPASGHSTLRLPTIGNPHDPDLFNRQFHRDH